MIAGLHSQQRPANQPLEVALIACSHVVCLEQLYIACVTARWKIIHTQGAKIHFFKIVERSFYNCVWGSVSHSAVSLEVTLESRPPYDFHQTRTTTLVMLEALDQPNDHSGTRIDGVHRYHITDPMSKISLPTSPANLSMLIWLSCFGSSSVHSRWHRHLCPEQTWG